MAMSKLILILACSFMWIRLSKADCYTPWGTQGHCVKIEKCNLLFKTVKQRGVEAVLDLLNRAQCGFEGRSKYPNFCCDTQNDSPVDSTMSTTENIIENELPTTPPLSFMPVVDHPNRRLLPEDLCGPIGEGRIYGGNDTSINEFPWMALLRYVVGTKAPEFRCGGSLINKHYVLTAAHCISSLPENMKLVSVRIGDYDLGTELDCDQIVGDVGFNCAPRYQEFAIDDVHVHPFFSKRKSLNDIALIRLQSEADMTPPTVRPICLPLGGAAVLKARKVVVAGWGFTEFGVRSEKLLKVTLPIMTFEKCRDAYKRQVKIWQKHICAGGSNQMESCSGDSGGPLQAISFYNGRPRTIQYGIVSFGPRNCGTNGLPGVYTSVAHYVGWILDQMTD